MFLKPENVNSVKSSEAKIKLKELKMNVGIAGAFGIGAAASAISLNIPLITITSIGFISKLPSILNGFNYLKDSASSAIPEYRFMLKNKNTAPIYENQLGKLVKSYVEDSDSLIEKRFKMEFISEWLHARDIYIRELKSSGLFDYSVNLNKKLNAEGYNDDRPLDSLSVDAGVVFSGICENDELANIQRSIYLRDFANEGIVGSLMIKGASEDNILEFLALQDYKLTLKDKSIIQKFLKLSEKEYLKGVVNNEYSSIDINEKTVSLIETGIKMKNNDGLEIAKELLNICKFAENSRLVYIKENKGKAENPVLTHRIYQTDVNLLETLYTESLNKKHKPKL